MATCGLIDARQYVLLCESIGRQKASRLLNDKKKQRFKKKKNYSCKRVKLLVESIRKFMNIDMESYHKNIPKIRNTRKSKKIHRREKKLKNIYMNLENASNLLKL